MPAPVTQPSWHRQAYSLAAMRELARRALPRAVFDFADFHIGHWHWPAFNVADSAIVVGVGLMLIDSLVGEKQRAP